MSESMSASMTAEILQFPARPAPRELFIPAQIEPTEGEIRLSRALAGLNDALTAQRAAIAAWKASLTELGMATGRLGVSLRGYHDSLDRLDTRIGELRDQSTRLAAWADGAAAKTD